MCLLYAAQAKLYKATAVSDGFYLSTFEEEIGARNMETCPAFTHFTCITEGSRAAFSGNSQDHIHLQRSTLVLLKYREAIVS